MKKPAFLKQNIMLRVLYALIPVCLLSVYFFGLRTLAVVAVSALSAFVMEWIMAASRNGKVSYACFVTAVLFALSLPPAVPLWIAATGVMVGILFGKEVFGGFGKNVFNPAIVGRAFVFVCFPVEMTGLFTPAGAWAGTSDAVTAATPMVVRRLYGTETAWRELFFGNVGGRFQAGDAGGVLAAGSMGEVSALLLILCGIYLIATKTAKWQLTVSMLLGALFMNLLMRYGLGMESAPAIPFTLFSGALLYAAVFMVTDPISAPKDPLSVWIYGAFIGAMVLVFRVKSAFTGGVAFAILLGNTLGPSLDFWIARYRASAKAKENAA